MLRSYWLPLVAAAGLALLSWGVQGEPINKHTGGQNTAAQGEKIPAQHRHPTPILTSQDQIHEVVTALKAIKSKIPPQDNSAKRSANAEEWGSIWALGMLIVAAIETAITGLGVYLVYRTLREAKRSADEARRAADAAENALMHSKQSSESELRAWLDIDTTLTEFAINGQSINFGVDIKITNIGKTPSPHTWISVDIRPSGTFVINGGKAPVISDSPHQMPPLLPNGIAIQRFVLSVGAEEVERITNTFATSAEGVMIVIDVIVYYRTIFDTIDSKRHMTSVRYYVLPADWKDAGNIQRRTWVFKGPDGLGSVNLRQDNSGPAFVD